MFFGFDFERFEFIQNLLSLNTVVKIHNYHIGALRRKVQGNSASDSA